MFGLFQPNSQLFQNYTIKDLEDFSKNTFNILQTTLEQKKNKFKQRSSNINFVESEDSDIQEDLDLKLEIQLEEL